MNSLFKNIPDNWQLCKIGDYTTNVEYGLSKAMNSEHIGVPILRMNNLDGEGFLNLSDLKYVDIPEDQINKYKLNEDDILFNRVNSVKLVGKTSIVKENIENLVFASYLIRVNVDNEHLLPDYLNYYLNSHLGTKEINRNLRRASSQANINAQELRSMKIIIPPIKEQKKIISLLFNIDSIINKTQKSIKVLEFIKKGLIQKLFTEGIGHTKFKKTRLGKIPELWEIKKLKMVAEIKAGGNAPQGNEYFKNGLYPFIRVRHFSGEKLYVDNWNLINKKAIEDYNLELYPKESIIFPKSGATINLEKRAILPNDSYVVGHLCIVIPYENVINRYFLFYFLKKIKMARIAVGTSLPYLNLELIQNFRIPLPNKAEQDKISKILFNIDKNIEHEINYLNKLKNMKKGLMQVLLTGKKRVSV